MAGSADGEIFGGRGAAGAASPALTLDLESRLRATKPLKPRKPDRVHTLDLTGEMAGYVWSINNVAWNKDVPPLPLAKGERVELVLALGPPEGAEEDAVPIVSTPEGGGCSVT